MVPQAMIAQRRTHPLTRLLAMAVLVIHGLAIGSVGFVHAAERWDSDVTISDPDASGGTSLHNSLCCPACQMGSSLPVPMSVEAAVLRALPAGVLPPARTESPTALHRHSVSPRAPPSFAA
jgi:hypothetical protein